MHLLITISHIRPYIPFLVTYALWGFVAIIILTPARLLNAMYQNARLTGKYHFRARYHVQKKQYRKEIFVYGMILFSVIGVVAAFHLRVK